jgi:hypothetical protein
LVLIVTEPETCPALVGEKVIPSAQEPPGGTVGHVPPTLKGLVLVTLPTIRGWFPVLNKVTIWVALCEPTLVGGKLIVAASGEILRIRYINQLRTTRFHKLQVIYVQPKQDQ